jgi:hypothetical protein
MKAIQPRGDSQFLADGSNLLAQPAIGRIGAQPTMPDHLVFELLHFARRLDQAHGGALRAFECQPLWKGQDHVALRSRAHRNRKKRNDKSYPPLLRECSQGSIDGRLFTGKHAHDDVWIAQVLVERKSSGSDGMVSGNDAHEDVREQGFRLQPGRCSSHIQEQVQSAGLDVFETPVAPRYDFQPRFGSRARDATDQAGQYDRAGMIGHHDLKSILTLGRVECLAGQQRIEPGPEAVQLLEETFTPGRSLVPAAVANQKLVPERMAQTLEHTAHCWLAEKAASRRSGDVLFLQQDGERVKEVEIGFLYMLVSHDCDHNNALDKCLAVLHLVLARRH